MDRIEDIEVFAEVAERGSFVAAARRLNRSPTAVTRAVAELEARLGVSRHGSASGCSIAPRGR